MKKSKLSRAAFFLLLACLVFFIPSFVTLSFVLEAKEKEVDFVGSELKGIKVQRPLESLFRQASYHRWAAKRFYQGEVNFRSRLAAIRVAGEKELKNVSQELDLFGVDLHFTPEGLEKRGRGDFTLKKLEEKWQKLGVGTETVTPAESDKAHLDIINHIKIMIVHLGDTSNLILDPDLDSYYLMDVALLALPQIQDRLQNIAIFVEGLFAKGSLSLEDRVQASVLSAFLKEADLDRINNNSKTSLNEDQYFYGTSASLQKNLGEGIKLNSDTVEPVITKLKELALINSFSSFDIQNFRSAHLAAIESVYKYQSLVFNELEALLKIRESSLQREYVKYFILGALAFLISAILSFASLCSVVFRLEPRAQSTKIIKQY